MTSSGCHGLITTGASIEEATCLAVYFERAAALQLAPSAAGKIRPLDFHRITFGEGQLWYIT
jgi:ribulose-5-phosphate 4-epimerase/fuculose-1-phosphate aldolase